MEGSLVAYKVFTNGSVLQASEINENLMRQSIAVFSNAAARTAAITSPVEGQMTWLEDVNRYEFYDGSSWQIESSGLVLINTTTFSGVGSQAIPTGTFRSSFDFYRVICDFTGATSDALIYVKMRASGTDSNASYFGAIGNVSASGAFGNSAVNNGSGGFLISEVDSATSGNHNASFTMDLQRPFLATNTTIQVVANAVSASGFPYCNFGGGVHQQTVSYDQINVIASAGSISGKIQVYGYRQ
jgi:hypothetical protein